MIQETKLEEENSEEGFKVFLETQGLCRPQAGITLLLAWLIRAGKMFF